MVIPSYPSPPPLFPLWVCGGTMGELRDNQSPETWNKDREWAGGSGDPKWVRRSEEKKSRVQAKNHFFHLSASAANTSVQTQTHTPVMEYKYLAMGKVGCFLIPPLKLCYLGEPDPRKTMKSILNSLTPPWNSYFDVSNAAVRAGFAIFYSPLTINAHQISAMHSQKPLDPCGERHSSRTWAVFYFYSFQIIFKWLICILGPYALWGPMWIEKPSANQTEYLIKL